MKLLPSARHELDLFALYFIVAFVCAPLAIQLAAAGIGLVAPLSLAPSDLSVSPPFVAASVTIGGLVVVRESTRLGIHFNYKANAAYWVLAVLAPVVLAQAFMLFERTFGIDVSSTSDSSNSSSWHLIFLVGLGPLVEEYIFRGLLYSWFRKRYSTVISAVITTTVFVLMHLQVFFGLWIHALAVLLLGAMLILLRIYSNSLGPAILAHCINNILAVLL